MPHLFVVALRFFECDPRLIAHVFHIFLSFVQALYTRYGFAGFALPVIEIASAVLLAAFRCGQISLPSSFLRCPVICQLSLGSLDFANALKVFFYAVANLVAKKVFANVRAAHVVSVLMRHTVILQARVLTSLYFLNSSSYPHVHSFPLMTQMQALFSFPNEIRVFMLHALVA